MVTPFGGWAVNTGRAIPSGSHCGTYRSFWSGGGNTNIRITNYNYGNGGCCGNNIFDAAYMGGGYYGGDCCHGGGGGGLSEGAAWTALGVGAGIGLLASPLGGPIMRGIGTGFKYLGLGFKYAGIGIGKAATWTWNTLLKPAGEFIWNKALKPFGQWVGSLFHKKDKTPEVKETKTETPTQTPEVKTEKTEKAEEDK